jgi:hypothetical protein
MLLCLPFTGMIAVGLGYTAIGLWQLVNGTGDPLELVVLAGVVIGLVLAWLWDPTAADGLCACATAGIYFR